MLARLEKSILGQTWAMTSGSFDDRVRFYFATGDWPGHDSKEVTEIRVQLDIDDERADGKTECANKKLKCAKALGLDVE